MKPYYADSLATLYQGDVLDVLRCLPDASVHCVVTSPPYYGLRDYGVEGQIGLEATPDAFVDRLVCVFREVRRVLRDDGTLWLNIGDSYYNYRPGGDGLNAQTIAGHARGDPQTTARRGAKQDGLKEKDLIGIPWMLAFALRADGWYLRSDIIWHKPNPMPESVTDRPTKAHEYLFLLTKNKSYFYDADAVRESSTGQTGSAADFRRDTKEPLVPGQTHTQHRSERASTTDTGGRNRRTVWTIATQSYEGAHFATFPEKLVEPCILAGTSERGCCPTCGAPWRRVVARGERVVARGERVATHERGNYDYNPEKSQAGGLIKMTGMARSGVMPGQAYERSTTGWAQSCPCPAAEPVPCTVLEPFAGSGTTLMVAKRLVRRSIGIDLNADYLALAVQRIRSAEPGVQLDMIGGAL